MVRSHYGTFVSGSVAEWSKALVLGTSHFDGVGSNPTTASFLVSLMNQLPLFSSEVQFYLPRQNSLLTSQIEEVQSVDEIGGSKELHVAKRFSISITHTLW